MSKPKHRMISLDGAFAAVAALFASLPCAALAQGQQPPAVPAPQPSLEEQRQTALRQIEDLRRQMEEMERRGRIMTSQINDRSPEEIEALGAETLQALQQGQQALKEARYDAAEPLLRRALELAESLFGRNEVWATILHNVAVTYHYQGRIAEAEAIYVRVLEWRDAVPGRDHADMAVTIQNLGTIYYDQRRYQDARTLVDRALEEQRLRFGEDHEDTLVSQGALGTIHAAQGSHAEAERLLADAAARMERALGQNNPFTLTAANNLGVLYRTLGRMEDAEQLLRRTHVRRAEALGAAHPDTLNSLGALGRLYREQGRYAEGDVVLSEALAGYRRLFGDEHPLALAAAANLSSVRLSLSRPAQALEAARIAVAGARARRGGAAADRYTEAQRGREEIGERGNYGLLAEAAWGAAATGDREDLRAEAFAALQDALGGEANQAIMQMAVRRYAESVGAGLGMLLRERTTLNERWVATMEQYGRAQADTSETAGAARTQLRNHRDEITQRLAAIDQRLLAEFPDYFSLIKPQALDIAATQALLGAEEAILLAVPTPFGTQLMAVTREGVEWARSDWNADRIQAAAERLRWDASGAAQGDPERVRAWQEAQRPGAPPSFDRATAFELYRQLIAPVEGLLRGKRRLYVAAGGALAALPFSLLVTDSPQGGDHDAEALRATHWLADRYALIHIPSVQSLALLRRSARAAGSSDGGFVGFGDPALTGAPAERRGGVLLPTADAVFEPARAPWGGAMASVTALRRMPQLPGTARELAAMREMFGGATAAIFTRGQATETAIRSADLSLARVIAFATHGLTPGDLVFGADGARTASEVFELVEPGLVLTPPETASAGDDGYLAASEVTSLRLNADWVILSACNSATPDDASEPGLSSLARAFFYAGARNLLASHWPVDDAVGARITVRTIELERTGRPRAEAFQQAMREIRLDRSHDGAAGSWAHPFYWAPFVLIGDGGS
jgi:CHAT domain-containing protein/tetratricopeptide (TPR) repeat protein